jgi:hypothetical protein
LYPQTIRNENRMFRRIGLVIVSIASIVGCGGNENAGPTLPAGTSEAMAETHALLLEASYGGNPLKSAKEMDSYASRFPKAAAAIKSGDVKIIWGKTIKDNSPSPEIIAFEKAAESGEGWAIKDDGKLHKVTSADITKLPKGK